MRRREVVVMRPIITFTMEVNGQLGAGPTTASRLTYSFDRTLPAEPVELQRTAGTR